MKQFDHSKTSDFWIVLKVDPISFVPEQDQLRFVFPSYLFDIDFQRKTTFLWGTFTLLERLTASQHPRISSTNISSSLKYKLSTFGFSEKISFRQLFFVFEPEYNVHSKPNSDL